MTAELDVQAIRTASRSDVGRTRSENQDSCGDFLHMAGARLLILADGMGGHAGGRRASRTCVDAFARVFERQSGPPAQQLRDGFELANDEIYSAALRDNELRGMGTTGVALIFSSQGTALVGWVGDSRAYRWRNGQLEKLTEDHALVAEWVRMGVLTEEQAKNHPRRSELTRAVGVEPDVEPDVRAVEIELGDRFLLCSDGLSGLVPEGEIARIVGGEEPAQAVDLLVERANAAGGTDNVSVQVVVLPKAEHEAALAPLEGSEPEKREEGEAAKPPPTPIVPPAPSRAPVVIAETRAFHAPSAVVGAAAAIVVSTLCYLGLREFVDGVPPEPSPAAEPRPPSVAVIPGSERMTAPIEVPLSEPQLSSTREHDAEPAVRPDSEAGEPALFTPDGAVQDRASSEQLREGATAAEGGSEQPGEVRETTPRVPDSAPSSEAPRASGAAADESLSSLPSALPSTPSDSVPVEIPELDAPDLPQPVREFLEAWLRAAANRDYRLYRELGFPDPPALFERTYARWERLRFEEVQLETPTQPGKIYLRAVLSYAFEDERGRWRTEDEHRLVLRETEAGLRYEARWK